MIQIERDFLEELKEYVIDVLNSELNSNNHIHANLSEQALQKINKLLESEKEESCKLKGNY